MKTPRDYQLDAHKAVLKELGQVGSTLVVLPTGCHAKGQRVLTFTGELRKVEDIEVGDLLMGPDSKPRTVLKLHRGRERMARIVPTKGKPWVVNQGHILSLARTNIKSSPKHPCQRSGVVVDISVADWMKWSKTAKHTHKLFRVGVNFSFARELPIDPYLLGVILGDGSVRRTIGVTTMDKEIVEVVTDAASGYGLSVVAENAGGKSRTYKMATYRGGRNQNDLKNELRLLGMVGCNSGNKFIPHIYKTSSRQDRLAVLAGLIDTDGHLVLGGFDFISKSETLAEDVAFVSRSLGFAAYVSPCVKSDQHGTAGVYFRVSISGDVSEVPCKIPRKQAAKRRQKKSVLRTGFKVESLPEDEYFGFTLDGDGRYLLDDFTVTHNCGKTVLFARLANEWTRGNVLVLAHRVELLEQAADKLADELGWRPPIEQANRGACTDLMWNGGHVVVGSVQTLRNTKRLEKFKDNPFGLVIVDEAHHATASSYQKVFNYCLDLNPECKFLGVTATPNRSDETALGLVFNTLAYEMTLLDAVELGWLVDVQQEFVVLGDVDFSGVGSGVNELGDKDFSRSDLEGVLTEEGPLHAMAKPILDKTQDGQQGLVFTAGVKHAHMLAAVLNRYREGCAAAVDGKTPSEERARVNDRFQRGQLQFLVNFGIYTEGFDAPAVSEIFMGRPTKSLSLYMQMLGRGTRPLPGVVDGHETAAARRFSIANSPKPFMCCFDFVGNSRHKPVSAVDALGGNYDVEIRQLAEERCKDVSHGTVMEELEKAKAERDLDRQMVEYRKRKITARNVDYQTYQVDVFDRSAAVVADNRMMKRGGATDGQINFLVALGVSLETASGYSKRQAGAVIESMKSKRCTDKQRAILAKYGEDPNVNFEVAKSIIDEIAANGWRRREGVA